MATAVAAEHLAHLQAGRGHRLAVEQQPARVGVVGGPHQPPAGQPGRHPLDDLQPGRVVVLAQQPGRAAVRVGGQQPGGPLVARLHQQGERPVLVPDHRHQVGEGVPVPADLDGATVEVDHREADVGVRRAGRRVRDGRRRQHRAGRVGQPPAPHRGGVGPGDGQPLAVRRPPVAAVAVHLLGRDELRQPPRDPGVVLAHEPPAAAVELGEVQRPAGHVGDPAPGRVGPRVEHGPGGGQLTRRRVRRGAAGQVGGEQAAGECERRPPQCRVGRVGHDAAGTLPGALAPRPLGRRQVLAVLAEQDGRVGDQPLPGFRGATARPCVGARHRGSGLALEPPGPPGAGQVEHEQPVDPVVAGVGAQERHPRAVRGDLEAAWAAEGEALAARGAARERQRLRHGR